MKHKKRKNKSMNFKLMATKFFVFTISAILFFELFLARSPIDFIVKIIILILVISASFFLIKSVKREIESRKEMEMIAEKLAATNLKLLDLDKQKSEFVANSAHHLRDPLTAIKGYASMILEGSFGNLSESAKEAIDRIFKSSQRLVVIINEFMDITRIESGEMEYEFLKADMNSIVKDIVKEMTPVAEGSGLKINLDIDNEKDYNITIDEGKIRQVISNLLDNSIKYTPHGTVSVSLSRDSNNTITLSVSDTGIGMSPDTIKKIFRKFSRADEASKFHTGGSGLGLYVASEILKKHKGRIWAESEGLGNGSTFYLELNVV